MPNTLTYYTENADSFIAGTLAADMTATADRFLAHLPAGASILDFGCGSGRDSRCFLDKGYQVNATDGSPELSRRAAEFLGQPVRCLLFRDLTDDDQYDGIWACASILHVPKAELPDVFRRMIRALHETGFLYVSFKYGAFEGERNGRYFTDFDEPSFAEFASQFPELKIIDEWVSTDVRPGRGEEKWLNLILEKETSR